MDISTIEIELGLIADDAESSKKSKTHIEGDFRAYCDYIAYQKHIACYAINWSMTMPWVLEVMVSNTSIISFEFLHLKHSQLNSPSTSSDLFDAFDRAMKGI